MTPSAVLFDLFDTLVLLDRSRLPEVHVNGKARRTTAGHLHRAFQPFAPGLSLEDFVDALFWSWEEAERIRGESHREVTAPERFGMMFGRLGLGQGMVPPEALQMLLATHMKELSKAVVFPPPPRRPAAESQETPQAGDRLQLRLHADGVAHSRARSGG